MNDTMREHLACAANRFLEMAAYLVEHAKLQTDEATANDLRCRARFYTDTAAVLVEAHDKLTDAGAVLVKCGELICESAALYEMTMPRADAGLITKH